MRFWIILLFALAVLLGGALIWLAGMDVPPPKGQIEIPVTDAQLDR